jgi:GNAT superfamily N-acetyltransferase
MVTAGTDRGASPRGGRAKASGVVRIVPANEASWDDLQAVVGPARCHGGSCYCQRFKIETGWASLTDEARAHRLREQTRCEDAGSPNTSGLVGYVDGAPAGWCAVEPRTGYPQLSNRIVWAKRDQDPDDERVWALTCVVVRAEYRRTGLTYELVAAAVDHARQRGARALEGYPMITDPGQVITWGELHVGAYHAFVAAGFTEVRRPTKRRVVMRIDFA